MAINSTQAAKNAVEAGYTTNVKDFNRQRSDSIWLMRRLGTSPKELASHLRGLIKRVDGAAKNTIKVEYDPAKAIPNSTLKTYQFKPLKLSTSEKVYRVLMIAAAVALIFFREHDHHRYSPCCH